MDPYQKKLSEMKGYVPFLDKMISRLEKVKDGTKDQQLAKMKDLLKILTTPPDKKLKLETLLKCEAVLQTLYEKIEGKPFSPVAPHSSNKPTKALNDAGRRNTTSGNVPRERNKVSPDAGERNRKSLTPSSPTEQNFSHAPPPKYSGRNTSPSIPSSVDRNSSNRPRNTGPGLLPNPVIRPSLDRGPPRPLGPLGAPNNLRPGRNMNFDGPRPPNFNANRFDNPNMNRPVTEPWAVRPPPFPPGRGNQMPPNRFPSPWLNEENTVSPWSQPGGFRPRVPPPNVPPPIFGRPPPPRQNFNEPRPQPWLRNPPPAMNNQNRPSEATRMENEWGNDNRNISPSPFSEPPNSEGVVNEPVVLPNTNQPPPWHIGDKRNSIDSDNRVSGAEWQNKGVGVTSSSLPSVPPPPPRISDIVASSSRNNSRSRSRSTEREEENLATPDSPEPQDMGIIDTPDSPDSSPIKNANPSSPSRNEVFGYSGHVKKTNENPKVIPLERQKSQQLSDSNTDAVSQNNTKSPTQLSPNQRKISFKINSVLSNKTKAKQPAVIESPASPPASPEKQEEIISLPTNIPTTGVHQETQKSGNTSVPDISDKVGLKSFQERSNPNLQSIRNSTNATSLTGRKTLLDTPLNPMEPSKSIYSPNWKPHSSALQPSDNSPSPSHIDHPGSASNSPYSPYSPGQSPQQTSHHRSSSNSPSTYSPYSPTQSSQPIPSESKQILDRNRQKQSNFQHQLPNLPQKLYPPSTSGIRPNMPQSQNMETLRPLHPQSHMMKKNMGPQPDHRNSMNMVAQNFPQGNMPPFRSSNMQPRQPMTYRDYRKWKEEQRQKEEAHFREINPNIVQSQPPSAEATADKPIPAPVVQRNSDPRKRPRVLASEVAAKRQENEVKESNEAKESNDAKKPLNSFKIPKKKKLESPALGKQEETKAKSFLESKSLTTTKMEVENESLVSSVSGNDLRDSGSDSEPELKIAEHETGSESEHETPTTDSKKTYSENIKENFATEISSSKNLGTMLTANQSDDQSKGKNKAESENKTKNVKGSGGGFLQSIVASMAPEDAEKLMQKANALGNSENITLKQLKLLLADDSDHEDEANDAKRKHLDDKKEESVSNDKLSAKEPKPKKPRVMTKPKVSPTPGVRKSRRLMQTEAEIASEAPFEEQTQEKTRNRTISIADSDDEDNQLVIDEETPTKEQKDQDIDNGSIRTNVVTVDFTSAIDSIEDHESAKVNVPQVLSKENTPEEKPKPPKKGRGRPRRITSQNESTQQDNSSSIMKNFSKPFVSKENVEIKTEEELSSNEEKILDNLEDVRSDSIDTLATENFNIKEEESLENKLPSGLDDADCDIKPTKPSRMRMQKTKMKTWFPGVRDDRSGGIFKQRGKTITSAHEEALGHVTIKKEKKEADLKVFAGQDDFVVQDEKFSTRADLENLIKGIPITSNENSSDSDSLKQRVSRLRSMVARLQHSSEDNGSFIESENNHRKYRKRKDKLENAEELNKATTEELSLDSNEKELAMVVTDKSAVYTDGLRNVICSLKEKVPEDIVSESTTEDSEKDNTEASMETVSKISLLDVVKTLQNKSDEPSPTKENQNDKNTIDPKTALLQCNNKDFLKLSSNDVLQEKEFKDESAWSEMTKPVNLKHLFKCMLRSSCSFTSDNAAKFRMHLEDHSTLKRRDRHGWLHCSYCLKKWSTPDSLISHIIKCHGDSLYQCGYCFHRQKTKLGLILHHQTHHQDKPKILIPCKSVHPVSTNVRIPTRMSYKPYTCRSSDCKFEASSESALSNHIYLEHKDMQSTTDYQCLHCHRLFVSSTSLVLHSKAKHPLKPVLVNVRHVKTRDDLGIGEDEMSVSSEDEKEEEPLADEKVLTDEEQNNTDQMEEDSRKNDETTTSNDIDKGFAGIELYRCGNRGCSFKAGNVLSFKFHITSCSLSQVGNYLTCFHCKKQLKHVPTLLEHLKSHGLKRYLCSLCPTYRSAFPINVKTHMKNEHRASNNFKMYSLNSGNLENPEEEYFLVLPKHSLPKGNITSKGTKIKDTYGPDEIDSIPPRSMTRLLLRCGSCDFSTKVRHNLVKHLRLHLRSTRDKTEISSTFSDSKQVEKGSDLKDCLIPPLEVPFITPVNEPTGDDATGKARMTNLLNENPATRVMSSEELKIMPNIVPENKRYACCHPDCAYCTLDEQMLLSHIQTIHAELTSYECPHCRNEGKNKEECRVEFDDVEFHLRCHGELLFKCCYCAYYHWQKRMAESHVKEQHPSETIAVRDVRKDAELRAREGDQKISQEDSKETVIALDIPDQENTYRPFRCSICDCAQITKENILDHLESVHGMRGQFKCVFCNFTSNMKTEIETHFISAHPEQPQNLDCKAIRLYYIDQYNVSNSIAASNNEVVDVEEKREPLWRRDMPGLKHIRGILYEDSAHMDIPMPVQIPKPRTLNKKSAAPKKEKLVSEPEPAPFMVPNPTQPSEPPMDIDEAADNFPMKCTECNLAKKTIKGLKMHIKLVHLRTGKFQCQRCEFSANILTSINTHYKIKHPDAEKADFEERKEEETKTFSQEFWKDNWLIPTLEERKKWVEDKRGGGQNSEITAFNVFGNEDKKTKRPGLSTGTPKGRKSVKQKRPRNNSLNNISEEFNLSPGQNKKAKKGSIKRKQKLNQENIDGDQTRSLPLTSQESTKAPTVASFLNSDGISLSTPQVKIGEALIASDTIAVQETSLFEQSPTYRCQYCPKRTQSLERIERHLKSEHSERSSSDSQLGYRILSRDQVVDMLTLRLPTQSSSSDSSQTNSSLINSNLEADYICYYCDDVVGTIYELKAHFLTEHDDNSTHDRLKVKKLQMDSNKKVVNGYLECQVCGYLSGGFDRSKQRVHFHEEHPLEESVNASKYVLKQKSMSSSVNEAQNQMQHSNKFELSKFIGMTIRCPKSVELINNQLVESSEGCTFEIQNLQNLAAMNAHLKKHTQTFKCGHCGKTHTNASDFHRHTAMSHGNKIPDLVKDPEAAANFLALKALVEANLEIKFNMADNTTLKPVESNKIAAETEESSSLLPERPGKVPSKLVARKSTGGSSLANSTSSTKEISTGGCQESVSSHNDEEEEFSYYGNAPEPINLSAINTQMSMGGMPIVLNVAKMSEIVNINPRLLVKDYILAKKGET